MQEHHAELSAAELSDLLADVEPPPQQPDVEPPPQQLEVELQQQPLPPPPQPIPIMSARLCSLIDALKVPIDTKRAPLEGDRARKLMEARVRAFAEGGVTDAGTPPWSKDQLTGAFGPPPTPPRIPATPPHRRHPRPASGRGGVPWRV